MRTEPCVWVSAKGHVCGMPESHPSHQPQPRGSRTTNPDYALHLYDPGERRHIIRRMKDRANHAFEENRQRRNVQKWNDEH